LKESFADPLSLSSESAWEGSRVLKRQDMCLEFHLGLVGTLVAQTKGRTLEELDRLSRRKIPRGG